MPPRFIFIRRVNPTPMFGICLDGVAHTCEVTEDGVVATMWDSRACLVSSCVLPSDSDDVLFSDEEASEAYSAVYSGNETANMVYSAMKALSGK